MKQGNVRIRDRHKAGFGAEQIRRQAAFFGIGDPNSKICRETGFRSGFRVQVFGLGADAESDFCDLAHLWNGEDNISAA